MDRENPFVQNHRSVFGEKEIEGDVTNEYAKTVSDPETVRRRLEAYLSKEELTGGHVVSVPVEGQQEEGGPFFQLEFRYTRTDINRPGSTFLGYVSEAELGRVTGEWETRIQEWAATWGK